MSKPTSDLFIPNSKCIYCGVDIDETNKIERHLPSCEYRKNQENYVGKLAPHFDFHDWAED
jgi:hypothetical protein